MTKVPRDGPGWFGQAEDGVMPAVPRRLPTGGVPALPRPGKCAEGGKPRGFAFPFLARAGIVRNGFPGFAAVRFFAKMPRRGPDGREWYRPVLARSPMRNPGSVARGVTGRVMRTLPWAALCAWLGLAAGP